MQARALDAPRRVAQRGRVDRLGRVGPAVGVAVRDGVGERVGARRCRSEADARDVVARRAVREQPHVRREARGARGDDHALERAAQSGEVFAVGRVVDGHAAGRVGVQVDGRGVDGHRPRLGVVRVAGEDPGRDHPLDARERRPCPPQVVRRARARLEPAVRGGAHADPVPAATTAVPAPIPIHFSTERRRTPACSSWAVVIPPVPSAWTSVTTAGWRRAGWSDTTRAKGAPRVQPGRRPAPARLLHRGGAAVPRARAAGPAGARRAAGTPLGPAVRRRAAGHRRHRGVGGPGPGGPVRRRAGRRPHLVPLPPPAARGTVAGSRGGPGRRTPRRPAQGRGLVRGTRPARRRRGAPAPRGRDGGGGRAAGDVGLVVLRPRSGRHISVLGEQLPVAEVGPQLALSMAYAATIGGRPDQTDSGSTGAMRGRAPTPSSADGATPASRRS